MKNFFSLTIAVAIFLSFSISYCEGGQELLYNAHKLWNSGDCTAAMAKMEKVKAKLSDFPADARKQVEATYIAWQETLANFQKISYEIESAMPKLSNSDGEPLPIGELQSAQKQLTDLLEKSNSITCLDIRLSLNRELLAKQDSANMLIDGYIDLIIGENSRLSCAVDSLRKLAKRYRHLLPILDSLRATVAKNSDNLNFLQAQLDSMVSMASQAAAISGKIDEGKKQISTPTAMMSDAVMKMVENKLIAIGEGKVRPQNYTKSERDTIKMELKRISAYLDTSVAAKLSPKKALLLKNLSNEYRNMLELPQQNAKNTIVWIVLAALVIVILLAVAQSFRRRKK